MPTMRHVWWFAVVVVGLVAAACFAPRPPPPAPPIDERIPAVVGQIVEVVEAPDGARVITLRDGLELRLDPDATQLSVDDLDLQALDTNGASGFAGLVLYGSDGLGEFYAAADNGSGEREPTRGFELHGGAFDEGERIHLSSGLLLEKAPGFNEALVQDWWFPLRDQDFIYLNAEGQVVEVEPQTQR